MCAQLRPLRTAHSRRCVCSPRRSCWQAEEGKRREARELEERFRRELEVPRAEKARLEERVAELQAKMTGLAKDAQLARRREEVARTEAEQLRSARAALEDAKGTLQRKVEELREQNAHAAKGATVEAAIRSTTDATIRRLENEIQFLKSQLAVEASCKDELQGALRAAQEKLDAAVAEHKARADESSAAARAEAEGLRAREASLRETKIALEGEVANLAKQLASSRQARGATNK